MLERTCLRVERVLLILVLASQLYLFNPGRSFSFLPYSVPLYLGVLAGLLLLWAVRTWRSAARSSIDGWDLAMMACGAWMGLSTAVGAPLDIEIFLVWESGLLLALYMRRSYRDLGGFRLLLVAAVGVLAIEALFSVVQYLTVLGGSRVQEFIADHLSYRSPARYMVGGRGLRLSRATGTFWTSNILGGWIVMWVPILLAGWLELRSTSRRARWGIGLLAAASLSILVRNLARVAMAVGILSTGFFAFVTWRRAGGTLDAAKKVLFGRRTLAGGAVVLVLVGAYSLTPPGRRFARVVLGKIEESRGVAQVRLALQRDAVAKVSRHLVIGAGHGRNRELMTPVKDLVGGLEGRVKQKHRPYLDSKLRAHNLYLMMSLDGGLPATIFYLAALVTCFVLYARRFQSLGSSQDALATTSVGFTLMSLGYNLTYLPDLWPVFMILFGSFRGSLDIDEQRLEIRHVSSG